MTTDGANLYITSGFTGNAVHKLELSTGRMVTLAGKSRYAGWMNGTLSEARFWRPGGITADGRNLYVSDTWNGVVRVIR